MAISVPVMDANARINLVCVGGVVGVALVLAVGSIVLAALHVPTPEWHGSALIGITGGLIGYLSRDPKGHPATVSTGPADTVNVGTDANTAPGG